MKPHQKLEIMKALNYKIEDTQKGILATIDFPEGTSTVEIVKLPFNRHTGNRLTFKVVGNYPKDKYSVSYGAGTLTILEKDVNNYFVGKAVNHKAFGKGEIITVSDSSLKIDFNGEIKNIMKSIASNFLS